MAIKFLKDAVYEWVINADKEDLVRAREELLREISQGLLPSISHKKELELIESRLEMELTSWDKYNQFVRV